MHFVSLTTIVMEERKFFIFLLQYFSYMNYNKYIIKEFQTYRLGKLVVFKDDIKKILRHNRGCFDIKNCWPGTVTRKINLKGEKTIFEICLHNIMHIDKPAHLYADHLNNFYESKLKKINKQKLLLTTIDDKNINKKILANVGSNKALFIIKNKVNDGLQILADDAVDNIAKLKFKAVITNCLSMDPLDFPVNSKKSNHYRLMERGLIIIERAPLIITKANIIKIIREYKTNPQDDAEAINIFSVK